VAFPDAAAPIGVAAGVVQTKCVVSIWILSLQHARISVRASFACSRSTVSWTLPKQTEIPDVSVIVCVRTVITFDGYTPAVVRSMSWNVYSWSMSSPESFVEVFCSGAGIGARRWPLRYISKERSLAVSSWSGGHSRVTAVWVTLRSYERGVSVNIERTERRTYLKLGRSRHLLPKLCKYFIL
jgi:hypothetical protein